MICVEFVAKAKWMKGRSSGKRGGREVQVFVGSHMSGVGKNGGLRVITPRLCQTGVSRLLRFGSGDRRSSDQKELK